MTDPQTAQAPLTRRDLLTLTLLIIALWLATRPFPGIDGDARYYTFEALNALHPGRYANDLYFKYGSQDEFTVFTKLFAPLVGSVGMWRANIIGLLACQFAWLAGLVFFALGFFKSRREACLAIAIVIFLPFHIGFINTGETCLTPRLPAEAISLWALGAMLRGRPALCLVLLAVAMPVHPLITLGAFGVFFVYQARTQPLWWAAAAAGIAAALALAIAGIQPFSRILQRFDPTWFDIIYVRDSFCFIGTWGAAIWPPVVATTALAIHGLLVTPAPHRRLLRAGFIVGWGGIIASYIGGDLLRNVLILDAQLWRCFWPLAIIAYLCLPAIYRQTSLSAPNRMFGARFFLILAILWLALAEPFFSIWLIAAPMMCLAAFVGIYEHKTGRRIPPVAGIACLAMAMVLCAGGVYGIYLALISAGFTLPQSPALTLAGLLTLAMILAILRPAPGTAHPEQQSWHRELIMLTLALLLAGFGASQWDRRIDAWTVYVDQTMSPPASLTAELPATPIYWEGEATTSWFLLQRPAYFSCDQGTGTLFSRQTAIDFQSMYLHFRPLHTQDMNLPVICPTTPEIAAHAVTAATLGAVCRDEPALGAMILLNDIQGTAPKIWVSPVTYNYIDRTRTPAKYIETNRFYIYDCAVLR